MWIASAIRKNEGSIPLQEVIVGTTRAAVIHTIESFLREASLSERRFGEEAVGDAKVLRRLRAGAGGPCQRSSASKASSTRSAFD